VVTDAKSCAMSAKLFLASQVTIEVISFAYLSYCSAYCKMGSEIVGVVEKAGYPKSETYGKQAKA